MSPARSGAASRNYYAPAAVALALLAWVFSAEFIRLWFIADHHQLGAFVVARIGLVRAGLAAAAAACAALAFVPPRRRAQALDAAGTRLHRWADHPAAPYAALLLALAFLSTELRVFEWEPMSEGVFTFGALRVLRGELPCRDFFTYVPPGWFLALAGLFKLFGATLETARIWTGIVPKLAIAAVLYRLSRRLLERPASLAVAALTLLVLSPNPLAGEIHPAPLTILAGLGTIPPLLDSLRTGRRRGYLAAGVLAALCATLRQDFGLYVVLADAAGLFLAAPRRERARALGLFLGAWGAVIAAVAALMLATIPFWKIEECYITGPLAYMARVSVKGKNLFPLNGLLQRFRGELTWPQTLNFILTRDLTSLVTWLGLAAGAALLLPALRRGEDLDESERVAALVLAFGVFFLGYAYKGGARPFIGCTPPALLLAMDGLKRLRAGKVRVKAASAWRAGGAVLLLAYGLILLFFRPFSPPPGSVLTRLPAGNLLFRTRSEADDLAAAVAHVQRTVPPDRTIFVYKRSRSAMSGNYVEFYVFAQRGSVSRYHELFEGTYTLPAAEDRLLAELASPALGRIVETDPDPSPGDGPDEAHRIGEYIRANFEAEARFGRFLILKRKAAIEDRAGMR